MVTEQGYNERLFKGRGLRNYLHCARFRWTNNVINEFCIPCNSVIEIGCFDGKLIDWLPVKPIRYVGIDANVEGGMDLAVKRFENKESYTLLKTDNPDALDVLGNEYFTLGVAMETLEHIEDKTVIKYLYKLSKLVDGYILITVPNEKGLVFLSKWLFKKIIYGDAEKYTFNELLAATLGNMSKVERNQHKGFDYCILLKNLGEYFDIIRVDAIPIKNLGHSLAFNIGIIAKTKYKYL